MEHKPSPAYAGFGTRFLAYWVDFLILFPLGLVVQQMLGNRPFDLFQARTLTDLQAVQAQARSPSGLIASVAVALAYHLIFWTSFDGATPGKKLLGIQIRRSNGEQIGYPAAIARYFGYLLSGVTFLFFGLGYLWVIWDKKKQALHDKIADTVVVKTGKSPQTGLAILLAFFAMIIFTVYMGAAMVKGFMVGYREARNRQTKSSQEQQNKNKMSPEAKVHYDKTQELFKELRTATTKEKVVALATDLIAEAKLATEAQPGNPLLWSNLGDAYTWMNIPGAGENALKAYKKAEELAPNDVVYMNGVGDQLIRNGQNEEAILQFQKTLRLTQNSGYAYFSIGRAYEHLKIYEEARTNYTKAVTVFKGENKDGTFDAVILAIQKQIAGLPK